MPIKEAEKSYQFIEIEKKIQKFWDENNIYLKTQKLRENNPKYSFLDGPPYCSGTIHLGTAWNKIIKDTYLRFKSMNGFALRRQAGWDTHGLPIEHKVEQLLGIKNKQEIEEDIGIATFIDECKNFAIQNKNAMTKQFEDLGVWMDWDNPYITMDPKYMESCWWTLKKAHEKDLLLKDKRVISWCPRCETALAAAEIDYETLEDPSIYIKFPLKRPFLNKEDNPDSLNEYFLVWTTTPWTLPGNLAICMNSEFNYSFIKINNEILILATDLVESILGPSEKVITIKEEGIDAGESQEILEEVIKEKLYDSLKVVKGHNLQGIKYDYPLEEEIPKQNEFDRDSKLNNVHTILPGDHVELGEGTGLVHTAPGHGPDDFEIGKEYNLPIFSPVNEDGTFKSQAGKYKGEFVKDANSDIIADLKNHNLLFKEDTIEHRYGTCWRCKTPIIYLATEQWFLKVTEIKNKMMNELNKVEWIPSWAGESRFKDWVENAKDWTISRQRYWGIPIPIWICQDCGEIKVIDSVKQLKNLSINEITANDEDLVHRPYVDEIIIKCDSCNEKNKGIMKRIEDVLDVWIDSGVAGWASLYYPQEKDLFNQWFPYDFITEGHDQTRGWFYSQLGTGIIAMDQVPYRKVLMHGFVLDEHGKKMSKSLGNVVTPEEVLEKYGVDVLRFYLLWASKPWDDLKFVWDELNNIKKMFNILWNVYVFSTTYMSLDNFNPLNCNENNMNLLDEDRWIISKVNSLVKSVEDDINKTFFHQATRKINNFILEDFSRWYVRLIRGRTWIEKNDPDKLGAYFGLYTALKLLIKAMAPITPHISEEIYENIVKNINNSLNPENSYESIHMENWNYDEEVIDTNLEEKMNIARDVIEAVARARDIAKYKLRWPCSDITIVSDDENVKIATKDLEKIIKDQSNAKKLINTREFKNMSFIAKPNLKTLGPKLRGDMVHVKKFLDENEGNKIKDDLHSKGLIQIVIDNSSDSNNNEEKIIELFEEDILFENELPEDIFSSEFNGGNVFINTEVTPEILSEAMAREVIRRIQDMRKDFDLDVEDNITVIIDGNNDFKDVINTKIDLIANEVRANNISFSDISHKPNLLEGKFIDDEYIKEWKIENNNIRISIKK